MFDGEDLWLVRDRLGVLPLYYYRDDRILAFASEIKALAPALDHGLRPDEASLDAYLAQRSVPAPHTMFEGIRKVLPGHWLRVAPDGRTQETPYWTLSTGGPPRADGDAVREVDLTLRQAVERSLVADVPIGALLSGGVDSSLLVALATDLRDGSPIATFSAGFGDLRHDETEHARDVSRRFRTDHHEITLRPEAFSERWRHLSWYRDAPLSEPADVAVFELASEARGLVSVLLTGEGADELFGGYPKYQFARFSSGLDRVPERVRRTVFMGASGLLPLHSTRASIALRAMSQPGEHERLATWFAPFVPAERRDLLGALPTRPTETRQLVGADPLTRMLEYDCGAWLADNLLERADRMAMAASVETRPPFLDTDLVELAFSLPPKMKVRGTTGKWILKKVAERYLPSHIVRRRKVGFRVPLDAWFRRGLGDMAHDMLLDPNSFVGTVTNTTPVRRLLDSHARGRSDESIRIWTLLSLEVWHQAYFGLDGPGSGRPGWSTLAPG